MSIRRLTSGVAELRVLLLLEGECLERIHHDARQPRGIENAFFEIEIPGAVLLRHQPALETVGEASDDTLQIGQLLVEIGAQAGELLGFAELLGPGSSRRISWV